jgi:hypothetical protein
MKNSCNIIIGLFITTLILITIIGSLSFLYKNKIDENDIGFENVKELENILIKKQEHISII